jgi:DNA-binding IclR family transcriptional regulator
MADRHWLEAASSGRAYALGIRVWEAGRTYLRAISLADRSLPYMEGLRNRLDETVQLAILDGRYNVYVAKATGSQRLILASEVGRRLEAHATGLGKVLLAGLSDDELESRFKGVVMERFTDNTINDLASLKLELKAIRKRGYGTDDEEYTLGVGCVAVPVRDSSGSVIAAMSVSVPTVRGAVLRKDGPRLLLDAADQLSKALGYQSAK